MYACIRACTCVCTCLQDVRYVWPFASPQRLAMGCSCINTSKFTCAPPADDGHLGQEFVPPGRRKRRTKLGTVHLAVHEHLTALLGMRVGQVDFVTRTSSLEPYGSSE